MSDGNVVLSAHVLGLAHVAMHTTVSSSTTVANVGAVCHSRVGSANIATRACYYHRAAKETTAGHRATTAHHSGIEGAYLRSSLCDRPATRRL